jgi:SAM-dependent methyltransferase
MEMPGGPASTDAMRSFWDRKARENPMWFVHSTLDYAHPDPDEFWASGEETLERTLEPFEARLTRRDRVLEVGCGVGRITRALARRAEFVLGLDVSDEMVSRAATNLAGLDNVEVALGNGRDLSSVPDATFDVAYSFLVFLHIPDPAVTCNYIAEMGRVVRPGGWTLFHVSEDPTAHVPENRPEPGLADRVRAAIGRRPRGTKEAQWVGAAVDRNDLLDAMRRGNLELEASVGDGSLYCLVYARRR